LRWDLDNRACVTEPEYQRERCARLAAGSSPVRQADGAYRCKCPADHVYDKASKRCVKRSSGGGGTGGAAQGGTGTTGRTQKKKKDRYDLAGRWEQGGNVVAFVSRDGVNYVGSMVRVSSDWQSDGIRRGSLLCEVKRVSEKRYKGRYLNYHKNGSSRWTGLSVAFHSHTSAVEFSVEGVYGTHNWYRVR